jgi:predicted Zn-dependent peptidase
MISMQQGIFEKTDLPNGITVVTEKMGHVRSVCIGIWVPAGSRYERREENGVSHFLEHICFKGTSRRTALDIAVEVDSVGGEMNAFTSREHTTYYIKVLDEHLGVALDILSDVFLHSKFEEGEMEKERQVILEEIRMQEDQPDDHVHDLINEVIWPGQAIGLPIAGREESVAEIQRKDLLEYVQNAYRKDRIIISCAGKVDHDRCVSLISEGFHAFSGERKPAPLSLPRYEAGIEVLTKDLEQVHLCVAMPGLSLNHPNRFAHYVLNTTLGSNMSSRLFQEIREKRGLAYSVYSYLSSFSDAGSMTIYTGASREKMEAVLEVIRGQLRNLSRNPISDEELTRAKSYLKGGLLLSLESSSSVMSRIAKQELYFEGYESIEETVKKIEEVTSAKVQEIAAENFQENRFSFAAIGPVERKELSQ